MSAWHSKQTRVGLAVFAAAMVFLAAWAFLVFGVSLVTAVTAGIAIACIAAMLYAWWLSRRALKPVERAAPETAEEAKPQTRHPWRAALASLRSAKSREQRP